MSNVGTVTFDIAAESAKLRSELDKVRKDVVGLKGTGEDLARGFRSAFSGVESALAAGGLTIGFAALAAGAVNATKAAIEFGDTIGKAATKAGIGTAEFQRLAYAARQVDVDMSAVSTALKVMQTNLSEAASGGKAASATINALGLEAQALKAIAPEQQFEAIAEQISKLTDPADRARAATELFGRAGVELLPMFEKGAEGIRAAATEAEKLGLVMKPEQLEALQRADESIKRLSSSWDGLAHSIAAKAAPAIADFFDTLAANLQGSSSVKALTIELEDLKRQLEFLPGAAHEGVKAIQEKRVAFLEAQIAALTGGRTQLGGSGPSTRGAHDFGTSAPPGFAAGSGTGTPAPTALESWLAAHDALSAANNTTNIRTVGSVERDQESEILNQKWAAELEALQGHLNEKLVLQDDYNQAVIEGTQFRESSIMDLFEASAEQKYILDQAVAENTGALAEMGYNMALDAMGRHSKAGKAIAIGQATIATLLASAKALSEVTYPLNFAAAAMVLASGYKTVTRIKGVDPMTGSGGSGHSMGSAGSLGSSSTDTGAGRAGSLNDVQPDVKARPMVQFIVNGDVHSGKETADWLMDQITTRIKDSDAVIIPAGSRQAQELQGVGG